MQKEEGAMKCVICHGDEIEVMEVKEEFAVGSDIVYVSTNLL
jgi:hypothetical protein